MDFSWIFHGFFMDFSWIFHGFFMDFSWIFHGFFMVYHWYISGSIFYTEGDSYLGRAKAQHRAAGAGQKGAAGGLPGGFPMGITWKNLGKYGNTWRKPKVFVSDVSLKVCVG